MTSAAQTRSESPSQPTMTALFPPIPPGATIGMVGGGQLGRMFLLAATELGYRVRLLCEDADEPAAQMCGDVVVADFTDEAAVTRFAAACDVITLEFENIPAATMQICSRHAPTYPSASVLATAQDRYREKSTLRAAGLPVTPFAEVAGADDLRRFAQQHGWPVIVKTTRSGYDGKGQHKVNDSDGADAVPWHTADGWVAEKMIAFDREVSVIVARSPGGETSTFPLLENTHADHILDVTVCPATVGPHIAAEALRIGTAVARAIELIGIVCVEMFVCGDDVMINEIAPRPHNSGHLTIEACRTSQFQQHVRAICGLPLGNPELIAGGAAMANLLGDLWSQGRPPDWTRVLALPDVMLHLYGKSVAKVGRKMGHLTVLSDDTPTAVARARQARDLLRPVE